MNAAYAVVSQRAGKVDLQAGLRLERAATRFALATTGADFDGDYTSAFPSGIVSFNIDEARQLKASYSRRISRPGAGQLNPFGFREDALTVFEGNPTLKPEYTDAYEVGFQQSFGARGSVQVTPFARHTTDAMRQLNTVDRAGVLHVAFQNAATSDQYGADVNATFRAGRLSGFGGASAFQQVIDATNIASAGAARAFVWSTRANASWRVSRTLDVQAAAQYRAPMRTEQGRMSRQTMANVALRQKLRGDNATATLRVTDPFGTMGWTVRTNDGRVLQLMDRRFGARGAYLNFSYAFGQAPRIRQRPPEEPSSQPGLPGVP